LVVSIALVMVIVAMAGLAVQAVRGNRTVSVQRHAVTIRQASLDDAFYHCIDVQARSLVTPREPVVVMGSLGDIVTLIKGVGSWVTIASPYASAEARLSLRDNVSGPGACLGTVVIATYPKTHHRGATVRVGSGATVPGHGPPPAPPL
jgi:hypothetical protein